MSKTKNYQRNLINHVAGQYLSEPIEGDYYDAYEILQEVFDNGNGDENASDYVAIWQPLEYKSVTEILELIDSHIETMNLPAGAPDFVRDIDWIAFQSQRDTLRQIKNFISFEQAEDVDAILNLLDAMEDYAIDVLGIDESEVLNKENDENM
jgi:hypothetical protein